MLIKLLLPPAVLLPSPLPGISGDRYNRNITAGVLAAIRRHMGQVAEHFGGVLERLGDVALKPLNAWARRAVAPVNNSAVNRIVGPSGEGFARNVGAVISPLASMVEQGGANATRNLGRAWFQVTRQPGITGVKLINQGLLLLFGGATYVGASAIGSAIEYTFDFARRSYGNGEVFLIGSRLDDIGGPGDGVLCENYRLVNGTIKMGDKAYPFDAFVAADDVNKTASFNADDSLPPEIKKELAVRVGAGLLNNVTEMISVQADAGQLNLIRDKYCFSLAHIMQPCGDSCHFFLLPLYDGHEKNECNPEYSCSWRQNVQSVESPVHLGVLFTHEAGGGVRTRTPLDSDFCDRKYRDDALIIIGLNSGVEQSDVRIRFAGTGHTVFERLSTGLADSYITNNPALTKKPDIHETCSRNLQDEDDFSREFGTGEPVTDSGEQVSGANSTVTHYPAESSGFPTAEVTVAIAAGVCVLGGVACLGIHYGKKWFNRSRNHDPVSDTERQAGQGRDQNRELKAGTGSIIAEADVINMEVLEPLNPDTVRETA